MTIPYLKQADGSTRSLSRFHCANEERELQQALGLNPQLIPGEQIDPEDPRRWLVIAREMPVPDPGSGNNRWFIDFLFADQSATPTLIEVKRFQDTRARREVIGQMFEYAANGHYYWDAAQLRGLAADTARTAGSDLETTIQALHPDDGIDTDRYFQRLVENLREGQLRIVFFLDEAPTELKVLVDFLNRQMERSEVLLVEAAHYRDHDLTLIVPRLFGYTEEARRVKRRVTVTSGRDRQWDADAFLAGAADQLDAGAIEQLQRIINTAASWGAVLSWGRNKAGSFMLTWPTIGSRYLLSFRSNGDLEVNLSHDTEPAIRSSIAAIVGEHLGLTDDSKQYPRCTIDKWIGPIDQVLKGLKAIADSI